ncbi:cytochrome c-type biogenesis protein CcmH [Roseibium hamelinense]|uniref:Cytochrome c-type biogenesis protein CcmH n=1 Tax=Roseibium hamelinense TaxID=150831 RepID=A0A562T9D9_9HYPH|nr:c-type cytochrome biogenesis protein CcmI [Roseibium hamelinense]MTI43717.1 c-type cytochrome biogenesis protein CcmI [Roseibium hamelinense]TWI89400.1 cytochrome c-type biogenesis protein CcmH [Roseibium hamelinense]
MILWILIAAMTAAAALSILVPLAHTRAEEPAEDVQTADEAVYRQQLEEVERDLDRGLIDPAAAEAARTEIARRLLAAHERGQNGRKSAESKSSLRTAQVIAVAVLPMFALGLYLFLGAPGMPDQPLSARMTAPAEDQSVDVLVARVEKHLAENPEDGQGWVVVAPVYMQLGKPEQAAQAYANAIRLLGRRDDWEANLGEALTVANDGIVNVAAREAFERAIALEPEAIKPRFFLALALGQEGKTEAAIAAWQDLLEGADPREAWVASAVSSLERLGGTVPEMGDGLRGPDQEQMAAASQMMPEDRQQMIEGMVAGLDARLKSDGGSADEWAQLMRAQVVLGNEDAAREAFELAQAAFEGDEEALASINDAAREFGIIKSN